MFIYHVERVIQMFL